jgi:ketosteroid isomerase-like protein
MIGAYLAKRSVEKGFEAFNQRDLDTYLQNWSRDAILIYPGDIPGVSGTYKGIEAIRQWYERDFDQFPTLQLSLESVAVSNILDMTGNNVLAIHWKANATNRQGKSIDNSGVNIIDIERGKVKRIQTYIFDTGEKFKEVWEA